MVVPALVDHHLSTELSECDNKPNIEPGVKPRFAPHPKPEVTYTLVRSGMRIILLSRVKLVQQENYVKRHFCYRYRA